MFLSLKKPGASASAHQPVTEKGARFWNAIERVLTIRPNGAAKLAALIRQTQGLKGLDWSNGGKIAEYSDNYSNGRAGAVAQCYLSEDNRPSAGHPI
jgi:hypothetical protein